MARGNRLALKMLAPVMLFAVACTNGSRSEGVAEAPGCEPTSTAAIELLNARALVESAGGQVVPCFDRASLPVIRAEAPASGEWFLRIAGEERDRTELELKRRDDPVLGQEHAFFDAEGRPPEIGTASVTLELRCRTGGTGLIVRSWRARWCVAPEDLKISGGPPAPAAGEDLLQQLDAARPETPWQRVWMATELARAAQNAGDPARGAEAWLQVAGIALESGVPSQASWAWRSAAYQLYLLRKLESARELIDRSQALDQRLGNHTGLVRATLMRGMIAQELGDLRAAERHFEAAEQGALRIGSIRDAAFVASNLAFVLGAHGRYDEAFATMDRAAPALARSGTVAFVSFEIERAGLAIDALEAARSRGEPEEELLAEAARRVERALAGARRSRLSNHEATALLSEAYVRYLAGDHRGAGASLEAIRAIGQEQELDLPEAVILRAMLELSGGRLDAALASFQELEQSEAGQDSGDVSDHGWRAAYGIGQVARARGDSRTALHHFRRALKLLEKLYRKTALQRGRAAFQSDRRQVVEDTISLLVERGDFLGAFQVSDLATRQLLSAFESDVRAAKLSPADLREWEKRLSKHLERRQKYYRDAEGDRLLAGAPLRSWKKRREKLKRGLEEEFDALHAWLEARIPDADPTTGDVRRLLGPRAALVSFVRLAGGWASFFVTREEIHYLPSVDSAFEPWAQRLAGVELLHVIHSGYAPALALPAHTFEDGRHLIEKTRIAYLPHAGFLGRSRPPTGSSALVVGDPDGSLPAARAEAAWVARQQPGSTLLIGEQATRERVLTELRSAASFHFAGHGVLRKESPWASHLRLATPELLTVDDLLVTPIAAAVVVLSGCETGVAQNLSNHHVLGLPEALLISGASGVLATEREVRDDEAQAFIRSFYARVAAEGPSRAYQSAARELIASGDQSWRAFRWFGQP